MTDEAWIDTVRLARDMGGITMLLPVGVAHVRDLPYPVFDAIRLAQQFLNFEELPSEERPPKRIWLDGERLTEWFDEVKRNRDASLPGGRREIEDPVENEAAKHLIVG